MPRTRTQAPKSSEGPGSPRGPRISGRPRTTSSVGLVLAGGSARGAYEVGVIRYVVEEVSRALGRPVPIDVISGTSAGSINACMLAAHADKPIERGELLAREWTCLELEDVVRPAPGEILHVAARMLGRKGRSAERRRGGVLDPSRIEQIVRERAPLSQIAGHIRAGHLGALSISTTHVASGRTVIFVQRGEPGLPDWGHDPTMIARACEVRAEHVLASAAVPLLFPAVEIDGQFFCDGGLRQNVPLSPARRLGADGLIVVNPRYIQDEEPSTPLAEARELGFPDPFFVFGKAMNALLLDRIENDINRLEKLNVLLAAGERRFGPDFGSALNEELVRHHQSPLRPLDVVYIRASQDIGVLAADYVRSPAFAKRIRGWVGRGVRRLGESESEADMLSYVLFDGPFAGMLIEMGQSDARARHDELVRFFAKRCEGLQG